MAIDAKHMHRRNRAVPAVAQSDKFADKKTASAEVVAVRFDPETPPHEEFKDFYPLHVTKVAEPKSISLVVVVIGIVFILGAAAGSGWYVLKQQKSDQTTLSATTFSDSNPIEKKLATDAEKIGSTKPAAGGMLYTNTAFLFQMKLPVSWDKVEVGDVPSEIAAEKVRPSELIDFTFGAGGGQAGTLVLQLRVDTEASYAQFAGAAPTPPTKILDTATYIISVNHQEKTIASTAADVAAVLKDTGSVIQSIQALVTPSP